MKQCAIVAEMLKDPAGDKSDFLVDLMSNRIPPGVDDAAYVKANFLNDIAQGVISCPVISKEKALEVLGFMQGGYNVKPLIDGLDLAPELAKIAATGLKRTLLMFDAFYDVEDKMKAGNALAKEVIESWANAEWFTSGPKVPEKITVTVFKVTGETNTDDLSPAPDAWSRPDIPLHALAMLKFPRDGIYDSAKQIEELKKKGFPLAYVGDVVGTGSSRKSATNSILLYMGDDIPGVPNKRTGGLCIGSVIAPIFFNTMEDSGALPLEMPVVDMAMGDVIDVYPYKGEAKKHGTDEIICKGWAMKSPVIADEVQAGGRVPLIIGRGLTGKAREALKMGPETIFQKMAQPEPKKTRMELGPEDGWQSVRRRRCRTWCLLRAKDRNCRITGHYRPNDAR
jgi:aconitate hydratase 2/2-methylisocitrate dehydratase